MKKQIRIDEVIEERSKTCRSKEGEPVDEIKKHIIKGSILRRKEEGLKLVRIESTYRWKEDERDERDEKEDP